VASVQSQNLVAYCNSTWEVSFEKLASRVRKQAKKYVKARLSISYETDFVGYICSRMPST
jgi:hypothetical protein